MYTCVKLVETPEEWKAVRRLRERVFVREQGTTLAEEFDEHDAGAVHAAAVAGGAVVGTGRMYTLPSGETRIGRMAVDQTMRREGIGGLVLAFLEERAALGGAASVTLHAQTYVRAFYERHGYSTCGEPFMEVGIEHVKMVKRLG
jgi:predicted GNAT family N-acyltransferase